VKTDPSPLGKTCRRETVPEEYARHDDDIDKGDADNLSSLAQKNRERRRNTVFQK